MNIICGLYSSQGQGMLHYDENVELWNNVKQSCTLAVVKVCMNKERYVRAYFNIFIFLLLHSVFHNLFYSD